MIKTLKNLINQFKIKRIKGDYFNLLKERELKAVFSNVPLDAFDNALEIGAGNGYFNIFERTAERQGERFFKNKVEVDVFYLAVKNSIIHIHIFGIKMKSDFRTSFV